MRLDDSGASGLIDELDKTLINDRTYEIVVHWSIANDLTISCARGVRVVLPTPRCAMPATLSRLRRRVVANRADIPFSSVRVSLVG